MDPEIERLAKEALELVKQRQAILAVDAACATGELHHPVLGYVLSPTARCVHQLYAKIHRLVLRLVLPFSFAFSFSCLVMIRDETQN